MDRESGVPLSERHRFGEPILTPTATVWRNFTAMSACFAVLYTVLTGVHFMLLSPPERNYLCASAAASAVLSAVLYLVFTRRDAEARLAHPLAAMVTAIVLANSSLQLYLTDQPRETTNFLLILLGAGMLYHSTAWLLGAIAVILTTWVAVALARGGDDTWTSFGIYLIFATFLSVLVHELRLRTLRRLAHYHQTNIEQRQELFEAIEAKDRAQDRFRRLSEATLEAILLHRNGRIVDANEQAIRLFGYSRDELTGMTMDSLLAPEARTPSPFKRKTFHSVTGAVRDGAVHETVAIDKAGRRFPIEFGANRQRPEHDVVDATAIRDITDRQRLEHRFRDFVDNAADYIYETDEHGEFTYVNSGMQHLFSRGKSLIGQSFFPCIHEEDRERIQLQMARQDFKEEPVLYQEFRVNSGEHDMERWVGQIAQPVFSNGHLVGYRMVARNVTDRVMAVRQALTARRQAEEASREKSRFLSSMSHELRTPLNGIMGFAQIFNDEIHGPINEQQKKDIASLLDCSDHLLTLIDDLLDLSKADINAIELRRVPAALSTIVERALAMVQRSAQERNIRFDVVVPDGLWVMGDPRRLRQVLLNLLSNAVKYSPESDVVRIQADSGTDGIARVTVADRGPGVPAKHREQIFSEFFQSDQLRDGGLGGSGIGLAIVKRLVSLHGGEVGYRDREGGGSEFWFSIEETTEEPPILADSAASGAHTQPDRSARILLVDDIEVNVYVVGEALRARGHTIDTARNGAEAIERAVENRPDLILMDMRMPVMDGYQATQKLKSMTEFQNIPIIALTASASDDAIVDCLSAGCAEHLHKPVQLSALFDCIERHLAPVKKPANRAIGDTSTGPALRVLVADDNEANRGFMEAFFKRLPDSAEFATNGREAVDAIRAGNFDVVLMDVQMPEMDGLEATRIIRKEKDAECLPIVGLSGLGGEDDIQDCLRAGMNEFITKPVRFLRVVEVLNEFRKQREESATDER